MASYLNVFCAGELETLSAKLKSGDTNPAWSRQRAKPKWAVTRSIVRSKFSVTTTNTSACLTRCPKLDHIAIPGGFGGAMENWGGITYYESRLLFDPGNSSPETKQNIYEVIAHEMAHMWFGDLVTMAWWDNLWLNEGFASWMGTKCTAKFNPQWEVWLSKMYSARSYAPGRDSEGSAMEGDARSTTHPIQQDNRQRSGSEQRLRRHHLQKGHVIHPDAGGFPR